ncbi:DnaD domain protein [Secundilactobacillus kimchicus]|uniref:DnaB/C C-terminal domain-containing protein n=1 Tax=Secundilactobacillus kimchicus JCM 15530 TaxID=1302272 RepID=A0A0R1HPB0_9LACO|nr:DnaD domain protein [Secundilactobacillus kimchicus]KRK48171.1 hypothetical protein FC96_GL001907 [Secundilactobacillus kimchicus JCM 15530]MBT9670874.1 DnaD domain protein [Secundilactobacillus kimchicus]
MNYITQIKAFYDKLENDPLNSSAIALWHALMAQNNKTAWSATFTVASSVLKQKSGIKSDSNFFKVRNELAQAGYIKWSPRKGNQAAIYSILNLSPYSGDSSGGNGGDNSRGSSGDNSGALNKLNKTKRNNDDDKGVTNTAEQNTWELWQQLWGFPNAIVQQDLTNWVSEFGSDLVNFAVTIAGSKQIPAKNSVKYVDRVLEGWRELKVTTIEAAKKADVEHQRKMERERKANRPGGYKLPRRIKETLPDWIQDDYEPPKPAKYENKDLPSFDEILKGD